MKLPELKELPTQELVGRLTAERDALVAALAVDTYEEALQEIDSLRIGVQRGIEAAEQVEQLQKLMTVWHDPAERDAEVADRAFSDGGSAQKAFWDGFERGAINGAANIRQHWNEYLQLRQVAKEQHQC